MITTEFAGVKNTLTAMTIYKREVVYIKLMICPIYAVIIALLSQQSSLISFVKTLQENADEDNKSLVDEFIKDKIRKFIKKAESKASVEDIKECLRAIHDELTLDSELWKWSLNEVAVISKEALSVTDVCDVAAEVSEDDSIDNSDESDEPMFSNDTVYHATLCCYVIVTKKNKDYFGLFNHQFDELSFSSEFKHDAATTQFLIARKGKTYFIAFHYKTELPYSHSIDG